MLSICRQVYEHLNMTPLINWKAWSPNKTDLCLEKFAHLLILQDHSVFLIITTFSLVRTLRQDVPNQVACLVTRNKIDVSVLSDTTVSVSSLFWYL